MINQKNADKSQVLKIRFDVQHMPSDVYYGVKNEKEDKWITIYHNYATSKMST